MATKKEQAYKWKFAIGTTSRVPNSNLHYFMADFDGPASEDLCSAAIHLFLCGYFIYIQETKNGLHLYSNRQMPFKELCTNLKHLGADPVWVEIGKKRGYFFLADKDAVNLSWPVERMALRFDGEKPNGKEG